jgi:hypothetical protein
MIDKEIREALDVDPSPEFLARVRTRIAAEPAPSTWRWSWGVAAACALAASAVLVTVVPRPHGARPVTAVAAPPSAIAERSSAAAVSTGEGGTRKSLVGPRPIRAVTQHAKSATVRIPESEPELLIDQGEMRTLRRLIEGVRVGRIDLTAARNSKSHAPAELEPVADIVIAPLTIDPIAPVAGAEGVRP